MREPHRRISLPKFWAKAVKVMPGSSRCRYQCSVAANWLMMSGLSDLPLVAVKPPLLLVAATAAIPVRRQDRGSKLKRLLREIVKSNAVFAPRAAARSGLLFTAESPWSG
jgi:hypothetical protein